MLALALSLVFLVLSQGTYDCEDRSSDDVCLDIKNPADCKSPLCWWESDDCGCHAVSCRETSHNTAETCKGSVGGDVCVWNPTYQCGGSTDGCCERASCQDYNHREVNACNADGECVWNPNDGDSGRCVWASCNDFEHTTEDTCKGITAGRPCVWDKDNNRCENGFCRHFYADANTCSSAGCTWCPDKSRSRCSSSSSTCDGGDELDCHNADGKEGSCKGTQGAMLACVWSAADGKCNNPAQFNCKYADGNEDGCKEVANYGCVYSDGKCKNSNSGGGGEEVDCHLADGNEEACKEGAIYGCVYSDGKCSNSAFSLAVPTLLITLLFVFML